MIITSFIMSPAVVKVPGTCWVEPVLVWLTISMPTGSRKTTIYQFLREILQRVRRCAAHSKGQKEAVGNCHTITIYTHINLARLCKNYKIFVRSYISFSPSENDPTWLLQDATFEKMGVLMYENNGRLLAMYDELSAFLTKIKLYSNRGLSDSHELAMFLELYNANPWTRTTGMYHNMI